MNGGIILPYVPDIPGVSMAWLKWEIFWAVIVAKRFVSSVIDDV